VPRRHGSDRVRDPADGWVLAAHPGSAPLLAEDVLTVGSPYHPAKQRLAFGLASSGGWVGAGDMAGDGLGAGPGVALEAGASAKSALPLGVAAVGAVGVGAGVSSVWTVIADRRCSESDQVEAGERVVDLLHRAACRQVAEVDRGEPGVLE